MKATGLRTGVVALGAVVVLIGTFLPWLASGSATRNAYGAAGTGERLAPLGAPVRAVLAVLPFLGLLFGLALVLRVLDRTRAAAAVALVLDLAVLATSVGALQAPDSGQVHVIPSGPLCTGVGAGIGTAAIMSAAKQWFPPRAVSRAQRTNDVEDAR